MDYQTTQGCPYDVANRNELISRSTNNGPDKVAAMSAVL